MPIRQRILITGASSGLGEEMARQFAALGRHLALCARRTDRLEALRAELSARNPGVRIAVRSLDVNDHDAVFRVFGECRDELGGLDRVIVNAGLGKGARIGTGRFDANRDTIETNLVAGLAQCEAAVGIFRGQQAGHLVVVSSMSAVRGMPGTMTAYAASKAGIGQLADGIRLELRGTPIRVTTLLPGYIESEMSDRSAEKTPLMVGTTKGVTEMVRLIEREVRTSAVPRWPWVPLSVVLRHAPDGVVRRFG